jgi:hypothetical protein
MKLNILKIALAVPLLVACGENDEWCGNENVATFSGTIEEATTRAYDATWEDDDQIGVSVVTNSSATTGSNVEYKVEAIAESGSVTFTAASTPITYGDKNAVDFAAYYPYKNNLQDDGVINITSSDITSHRDYMFAKGSGKSAKPNVAFRFSHVMSQVVLKISAGTGVSLSDLSELSIGDVVQDGTFNTCTGDVDLADGATPGKLTISQLSSPRSSINLSQTFLPQTLESLSLELTVGETKYAATLSLPAVNGEKGLFGGYSVSYNITVNKTSLNASDGTIIGWVSEDGTFDSAMLGTHLAAEAALYDLAMSDGSFISVWPEGTTKDLELTDLSVLEKNIAALGDKINDVVGLVYYTGDLTESSIKDKILQYDYPECNHGFILALKDMGNGDMKWQNPDESVYGSFQNKSGNVMYPSSDDSKYEPISVRFYATMNNISGDVDQLNKALGYNNTKVIRAYNYYYAGTDYKVQPIKYLDEFAETNKAPKGSSGWFLPSSKELVLLLHQDNLEFANGGSVTSQYKNIMTILKKLNAKEMQDYAYWTSTECDYIYDDDGSNICLVLTVAYAENLYGNVGFYYKSDQVFARAVCAF